MKTLLYTISALLVATSAAMADSTVSSKASVKAPERGEVQARDGRSRVPVSLQRAFDGDEVRPASNESGYAVRQWSGNENEG